MTPERLDELERAIERWPDSEISEDDLHEVIAAARERDQIQKDFDAVLEYRDKLEAERGALQKHNQSLEMMVEGFQAEANDYDALKAENARLRKALEDICNFAWSLVAVEGDEARDNINTKLNKGRAALKTEDGQ